MSAEEKKAMNLQEAFQGMTPDQIKKELINQLTLFLGFHLIQASNNIKHNLLTSPFIIPRRIH